MISTPESLREPFVPISLAERYFNAAHVNELPASYRDQFWVCTALRHAALIAEAEIESDAAKQLDTPEKAVAFRRASSLGLLAEGLKLGVETELASATESVKVGIADLLRGSAFDTADVTGRPKECKSIVAKVGRRQEAGEDEAISDGVAITLAHCVK